jgi:hypothetical protein
MSIRELAFNGTSRQLAAGTYGRGAFLLNLDDVAPTGVAITYPTPGLVVWGNVTVTATASDNHYVKGVQFKLDGADLGAEDTTAPYSVVWNASSAGSGLHTLTAVAKDPNGNPTTSPGVIVNVSPPE